MAEFHNKVKQPPLTEKEQSDAEKERKEKNKKRLDAIFLLGALYLFLKRLF